MLTADDEALIDECVKNSTPILTNSLSRGTIEPSQISPLEAERKDMPYSDIGEKFSTSTSQFVTLKDKGDKIRFRLLGRSFINGKHFEEIPDPSSSTGKKWNITPCPRINERVECETCNKYFEIVGKAKKTDNKELIKKAKEEARPYQAAISVYFPILNRETMEYQIFQSKMSVKNALDTELDMGTKVYNVDWIVMRTEIPGKYYTLKQVDSSDTPPLAEEEMEEIKKYKDGDLAKIVMGTPDESELAAEAVVEVEDDDKGTK
jgi:hypothetical protein